MVSPHPLTPYDGCLLSFEANLALHFGKGIGDFGVDHGPEVIWAIGTVVERRASCLQ